MHGGRIYNFSVKPYLEARFILPAPTGESLTHITLVRQTGSLRVSCFFLSFS